MRRSPGKAWRSPPDDSLEYWLNQIAENGGGGSSDFSTATVTLNLTLPDGDTFSEGSVRSGFLDQDLQYVYVESVATNTATFILYKGECFLTTSTFYGVSGNNYDLPAPEDVTLSGGVTYDAEHAVYVVTSDGTLTATLVSGGK